MSYTRQRPQSVDAYYDDPNRKGDIGGQWVEQRVSDFGAARFSTALLTCGTLIGIAIGVVALILVSIIFGFWSTHPTVIDAIITDNEIYVNSVHSVNEIVGDSLTVTNQIVGASLTVSGDASANRYVIQGEPAVRLEPSSFLSGSVMILGSETNDFTRIAAKSLVSVYIQDTLNPVCFGPFGPYFVFAPFGAVCAPFDVFTGPITQIITPNIHVMEQLLVVPDIFIISDEKLKENILPLEESGSIAIIRQLSPKSYEFLGSEQPHIGFVAQEVQQLIPEAVGNFNNLKSIEPSSSVDEILGLEMMAILAHVTNAVKNIDQRLQTIENASSSPPTSSSIPIMK